MALMGPPGPAAGAAAGAAPDPFPDELSAAAFAVAVTPA